MCNGDTLVYLKKIKKIGRQRFGNEGVSLVFSLSCQTKKYHVHVHLHNLYLLELSKPHCFVYDSVITYQSKIIFSYHWSMRYREFPLVTNMLK